MAGGSLKSGKAETRSWAEIQMELARKVTDVLYARVQEHLVEGTLSERELRLLVDSLYDTVSGLVPWETANMIYDVRKDLSLDA